MDDDLEAILAADEAMIRDDGFAATVARSAGSRSKLRRGWLAAAGIVGLSIALFNLSALWKPVESAMESIAPAKLVLSLPVIDLSLQMRGESLIAIALGMVVLLTFATTRFVSDDL